MSLFSCDVYICSEFHPILKTLHSQVEEMGDKVPEEISILAQGPFKVAQQFSSYTRNGLHFHTQSYDDGRPVQNSGVALVAQTTRYEKGNADNMIIGNQTFYGIIKEIATCSWQQEFCSCWS